MNDRSKKCVLFLCTHNSARSQMAEGLLRGRYGDQYEAFSAGTVATRVKPMAIEVMAEVGIDISNQTSKALGVYLDRAIDVVITVCDSAKETCPIFPNSGKQLHCAFRDPSDIESSIDARRQAFRDVRDQIGDWIDETFG